MRTLKDCDENFNPTYTIGYINAIEGIKKDIEFNNPKTVDDIKNYLINLLSN